MSNMFCFALIAFLLIVPTQKSFGQSLSNHVKEKIEQRVDSIFHRMIKIAENLDYEQLSQGVDDKHKSGFIINGVYYSQFDSLINDLKAKSERAIKQSITILNEKVTALSQNIVLITANGISNVEINDGNHNASKFFWTFVYEKDGHDWKVIQSHQSNIR